VHDRSASTQVPVALHPSATRNEQRAAGSQSSPLVQEPPVAIVQAPVERVGSSNPRLEHGAMPVVPAHEQTSVVTLSHAAVDDTQVPLPEQSPTVNWHTWSESGHPLSSVHEGPSLLLLHP
jgi:hypothetical protein